ncbi:MAG: F0F1 ATP synthase subunit I [Endozoicomonadaceae bacterium]|nr:F0F1 ATP synthase subunit I [Endozoicomonadaceae bacterium]
MQLTYKRNALAGQSERGIPKSLVYRVILVQMAVTAIMALGLLVVDRIMAMSALLGGLICLLPNAWLVRKTFAFAGAQSAQRIVNSFYQGEAGKFLLTFCGFALVFAWVRPLHPLILMSAFVVVQAVNWFAPVILNSRVS